MASRANHSTAIVGFTAPSGIAGIFITISPSENKSSEFFQTKISTLRKDYPEFKLIGSNTTTLAGLPAYMLSFSGRIDFDVLAKKLGVEGLGFLETLGSGLGDLQQMSVVTIKNDKAYQVGYGGLGDEYSMQFH
jgi:hypothetical protein